MRKKYLSALLFGALLVTSAGTFTSCKDYDDEINNLQEQVDKLATKEDMEAKLSQMQAAIDAAKKTAEEALAKAEQGGEGGEGVDQEEIDKLKERIAALEEAMAKVETLKAEIKDMVDGELADFREEMKEFMKEVEELTGYSLTMITEISFVDQYNNNGQQILDSKLDVNFARTDISYPKDLKEGGAPQTPTSYEFGKGFTGAFTINDGDVNTVKDNMLVKVAPVDAVITSEMVSLINGKGENLNDYVNMSVATWSENIISSRSASTGLYTVGVQLKNDVDFEAFDKMVLPSSGNHHPITGCDAKHKFNMFALAISDSEKSRTVTSDYAVTLHVQEEAKATDIKTNSKLISSAEEKTLNEVGNATITGDNGGFQIVSNEAFELSVGSKSTGGRVMASYVVLDVDNSDRGVSQTDKVAISTMDFEGLENITRDGKHTLKVSGAAGVAIPMKLVTIDYTGNVEVSYFWVRTATPALMTVSFIATPSEYIASETSTGNLNKTLFKEGSDVQEFKVPAGAKKYTLSITPGEKYAAFVADAGASPAIVVGQVLEPTTVEQTTLTAINYSGLTDDESNTVIKLLKSDKKTAATKQSEVAYASYVGTLNLPSMREDTEYTGYVKFYDENDNYLGENTIKVTKKLPTDVPAGFSAKTNTIVDGVMTVYPKPLTGNENSYSWPSGNAAINVNGNDVDGDSYTLGYFDLLESFNGWVEHNTVVGFQNTWKLNNGYGLTVKGVTDTPVSNASPNPKLADYTENINDGVNFKGQISSIRPSIIGNGEAYESIVKYNYGNIKYVPVGHGVAADVNHTVNWSTKLDMKFGHWIKDSKFQWTTGENPVVIAGQETTIFGKVTKSTVNGVEKVTAVDAVMSVTAPNNETANPFASNDANWIPWAPQFDSSKAADQQNVTIELRTVGEDGSVRKNEFFTAMFGQAKYDGFANNRTVIKLTPSTYPSVVVGNDVETKVYFIFEDNFGVKQEVHALTFTMKYKKN